MHCRLARLGLCWRKKEVWDQSCLTGVFRQHEVMGCEITLVGRRWRLIDLPWAKLGDESDKCESYAELHSKGSKKSCNWVTKGPTKSRRSGMWVSRRASRRWERTFGQSKREHKHGRSCLEVSCLLSKNAWHRSISPDGNSAGCLQMTWL